MIKSDSPQNVRKYIKQTIVSDFNEDPGPLFSFEKTQNFDNITSVLEKQVEMIDGQINELMRSKQQAQNAIKAVNDIVK